MQDTLRFGTDGWRDRIGERFTVANVRRAAHATAGWLTETGGARVLVAHDTRFGGAMFARAAAETLAAHGLDALLHDGPLPTPVLSFAVRHLGADAGVMLTASHNPPAWNGFKLKGAYGGTATQDIYRAVADRAAATSARDVPPFDAARHRVGGFDPRDAYFEHLAALLDLDALRALSGTLVHDAMGGAAAGWIRGFARHAGLSLAVEELRGDPDPMFHGAHPEPIPAHMAPLVERMRRGDALLGVATDGDGDRLGGVLPGGRGLDSHEIFALLLDRLERAGGRGRVVKTVTVSRLVERLAGGRGLDVVETPVGFKHLVDELLAGGVLIAGEESGGIGIASHLPERDGIANTMFLLEAAATGGLAAATGDVTTGARGAADSTSGGGALGKGADGDARGGPLGARLDALQAEVDWRHAYDRLDLALSEEESARVAEAMDAPPDALGQREVTSVERRDGLKLNLSGKAWVLVRASGTEPLLRIYCEAQSAAEVRDLLSAARGWATGRTA